jgi:hypothetical protein
MKKNVGTIDKIIRLVAGAAIITLGRDSWWWVIGFLPIATAVFSFCPTYTLFGMNTRCCCSGESECCSGKEEPPKTA